MKQALIMVAEIKRMKTAIRQSTSKKLKHDYRKAIKHNKEELKEYCAYKNLNYNDITKDI